MSLSSGSAGTGTGTDGASTSTSSPVPRLRAPTVLDGAPREFPKPPSGAQGLQAFVRHLFTAYGHVRNTYVQRYTDEEAIENVFRAAFDHKSFSRKRNYELLEFLGDPKINDLVAQYVHTRHPRIVSVKWLTRMKHYLMSKKILARLALEIGFLEHIRFGQEIRDLMSTPFYATHKEFLGMLEDCFEAFAGAVFEVIVNRGGTCGVAYEIMSNIVGNMLGCVPLPLDHKVYFDAKTRLKEVMDQLQWVDERGRVPMSTYGVPGKFTTQYFGFPKGVRIELARADGCSKEDSEQYAAEAALARLATEFHIHERISNPFEG